MYDGLQEEHHELGQGKREGKERKGKSVSQILESGMYDLVSIFQGHQIK
jgi:hypothetical protein